jgi:hypothetical protein
MRPQSDKKLLVRTKKVKKVLTLGEFGIFSWNINLAQEFPNFLARGTFCLF